jgi:hypothetical protein
MYGSLQGISDNAIGHVKALDLPYTEKNIAIGE